MKRPEQPCKRDCAKRRIGCHAMCDDYSDYEFKKQLWYAYVADLEKCNLSPIRKFYPYQVECAKRGIKIYHLNIGQPDIATPPAYFDAVRDFKLPVLEYAPSPGIPDMIKAVQGYYDRLGIHYENNDIFVTTGGSEALTIALNC